jgi:hypothetical protein
MGPLGIWPQKSETTLEVAELFGENKLRMKTSSDVPLETCTKTLK